VNPNTAKKAARMIVVQSGPHSYRVAGDTDTYTVTKSPLNSVKLVCDCQAARCSARQCSHSLAVQFHIDTCVYAERLQSTCH